MWLRLALQGDVEYVNQVVASYRRHADTITASTSHNDERLLCDQRALEHAFRHAASLQGIPAIRLRSRTAQAFRWLLRCGEHVRDGRRRGGLVAATRAWRLLDTRRSREARSIWMQLFAAVLLDDEYACYLASKRLMRHMHAALEGTRYGASIEKIAVLDGEWLENARLVAACVREATGPSEQVAVIDKCDPTILHHSRRRGRHFPDLPGLAKGAYPATSHEAIEHLEAMRDQGIAYLVVPRPAFWWLDFYGDFSQHLDTFYCRTVSNEHVVIFALSGLDSKRGRRESEVAHVAA
jgi:hypothetical protein